MLQQKTVALFSPNNATKSRSRFEDQNFQRFVRVGTALKQPVCSCESGDAGANDGNALHIRWDSGFAAFLAVSLRLTGQFIMILRLCL